MMADDVDINILTAILIVRASSLVTHVSQPVS